jgi:hypothetical protein
MKQCHDGFGDLLGPRNGFAIDGRSECKGMSDNTMNLYFSTLRPCLDWTVDLLVLSM